MHVTYIRLFHLQYHPDYSGNQVAKYKDNKYVASVGQSIVHPAVLEIQFRCSVIATYAHQVMLYKTENGLVNSFVIQGGYTPLSYVLSGRVFSTVNTEA